MAAILVEQGIQSIGQRDPARDGIKRAIAVLIDGQVRQIAEMAGMIAGTGTDVCLRIHVLIDFAGV
jgi:hypothetical protein